MRRWHNLILKMRNEIKNGHIFNLQLKFFIKNLRKHTGSWDKSIRETSKLQISHFSLFSPPARGRQRQLLTRHSLAACTKINQQTLRHSSEHTRVCYHDFYYVAFVGSLSNSASQSISMTTSLHMKPLIKASAESQHVNEAEFTCQTVRHWLTIKQSWRNVSGEHWNRFRQDYQHTRLHLCKTQWATVHVL